ncbi:uncharacterized protein LOC115269766 [Aedes albopictus]|uniref:Uncharacterized protein n=1 Tax=Aedes albopictus TaxID=7160 RepID=A0ABM1Z795_AEDAL
MMGKVCVRMDSERLTYDCQYKCQQRCQHLFCLFQDLSPATKFSKKLSVWRGVLYLQENSIADHCAAFIELYTGLGSPHRFGATLLARAVGAMDWLKMINRPAITEKFRPDSECDMLKMFAVMCSLVRTAAKSVLQGAPDVPVRDRTISIRNNLR